MTTIASPAENDMLNSLYAQGVEILIQEMGLAVKNFDGAENYGPGFFILVQHPDAVPVVYPVLYENSDDTRHGIQWNHATKLAQVTEEGVAFSFKSMLRQMTEAKAMADKKKLVGSYDIKTVKSLLNLTSN